MTPIEELQEDEVVELLEHDVESERLLGEVHAALKNLREIAGKTGRDNDVDLDDEPSRLDKDA